MRVQFKMEGGLAHFPGLNQPVTFDTRQLSAEEAGELGRLIEASGFFDLPETSAPRRAAADGHRYTIAVSSPEHSHTISVEDPIEETSVRALVDYLRMKTRELRAASRARGSP